MTVVALLLVAVNSVAESVPVNGRVLGDGDVPLAGAIVSMRGTETTVDANGDFAFQLDTPTTLSLRVRAPGYYPFIHTVHRSDFVSGRDARLPDIRLVKKAAGRTLFMFAGDAMLSRRYFEPRAGEPVLVRQDSVLDDGKKLLAPIRPYVELADLASVNMETQLSTVGLTDRLPKSVTFYSPDELATLLQWAGFDYVALGNNHLYDYQDAGLVSTFAALGETELVYSGAGASEAEAREPGSVDIAGRSYHWLSYVGWAGTFEPNQVAELDKGGAALGNTAVIAEDLARLPKESISVLQLHAGLEYAARPALSEQTTLRQAIKDGADVAIGHHPHVLQGLEIVDDRLIAYSMGNFLFDQYHYTTQLGMLLYVWMDGDTLYRAEAVPLHVNGYIPTPATGLMRHAILTRLARLSGPRVCMTPSGFHAAIEACIGERKAGNKIAIPDAAGTAAVHVRELGASPLLPVQVDGAQGPYRFGIDLLRRGDFEYARLFGAHDRTWIESRNAALKTGENNRLEVRVPVGGKPVRTGLKVFERTFALSSPATVSGRLRVEGNARIRFLLQRRRANDTLQDALQNGPITEIGTWEGSTDGWTTFSFDYNQPRVATRSVRLLMEFSDLSDEKSGVTASVDDLAWIEWQTPWISPGDANDVPVFATHLELRSKQNP